MDRESRLLELFRANVCLNMTMKKAAEALGLTPEEVWPEGGRSSLYV